MMRNFLIVLTLALLCVSNALAFDPHGFMHTVPVLDAHAGAGQQIKLAIDAAGIKRARVLVAMSRGYKSFDMQKHDERFEAMVSFQDLALLKYQFQVEGTDGALYESDYYTLREPASQENERLLAELSTELESISAKERQLENALYSLKKADPAALARRKNQEMSRALVTLGQRERESAAARLQADANLKLFEEKLAITAKGMAVNDARSFLDQQADEYMSNYEK